MHKKTIGPFDGTISIDYDGKFDILNIGIGDNRNAIGCETDRGVTIMRDEASNEVVGVMIEGPRKKLELLFSGRIMTCAVARGTATPDGRCGGL